MFGIIRGSDGKYYVQDNANPIKKAAVGLANFGVNVDKGEKAQAEGVVNLAKEYYKEGQKGAMPVTKLTMDTLGNMVKGYLKGAVNLATNPIETVTQDPVGTFNTLSPLVAGKVLSAKPTSVKSYLKDVSKRGDLIEYENAINKGNFAVAEKLGKAHAGDARYQIHKQLVPEVKGVNTQTPETQTAGINQLISHEGAPDRARVEFYKQKIANGEKIDPLIVVKEGKKWGIEDGKHRYQAFIESGYNTVPVIVRPGMRSVLRKPNGQFNGSKTK